MTLIIINNLNYCLQDLSKLIRDLSKITHVSAHAFENSLHPENCVPVKPFKIDEKGEEFVDATLSDLIPFLEHECVDFYCIHKLEPILLSLWKLNVCDPFFISLF
ncbi:hypothetical protein P3X46_027308 [Hevea brasiliensis]|uniref:FCP1 homology domain-containing protein n=1 Tax=Hevea brasiliensis TaxID=3981 RepID=A0ABQ9KZG4_HEVBR|nr:hypothetical protein P3X46_027308 [Hevea brasiliensis]